MDELCKGGCRQLRRRTVFHRTINLVQKERLMAKHIKFFVLPIFFVCVALLFGVASTRAATITSNLGNTSSGLSDGDLPVLVGPPFPDIISVQGGQPAPFDQGYGLEVAGIGANFSVNWTHSFGAIVDSIVSASLTIGIYDHDSAASGSQLSLFDLDGADLTATLNALFETPGDGEEQEYNVYTVALPGSVLPSLADGSLLAQLDLDGPGQVRPLFPLPGPNPVEEVEFNGAHLIFSTLTIETQPVPESSTLALMGLGNIGLLFYRRRRELT
jgi:hypothetical protein